MFFYNLFRVHTYIPLYQCFLFLFFSILQFVNFVHFFPFFEHLFLKFTLLKRIFPISSKTFRSHSAKNHWEKSLLCTEFLLFFHSRSICYDHPCNFSFSPKAPPIIATGQGETAPTLVHSPCWVEPLGFRVLGCRFRDPDFCLRTLHVSIMFWSCPQKLWDFHRGSNIGQVHLTKANWPHKAHLNCS